NDGSTRPERATKRLAQAIAHTHKIVSVSLPPQPMAAKKDSSTPLANQVCIQMADCTGHSGDQTCQAGVWSAANMRADNGVGSSPSAENQAGAVFQKLANH